jgi:hypothetical protein
MYKTVEAGGGGGYWLDSRSLVAAKLLRPTYVELSLRSILLLNVYVWVAQLSSSEAFLSIPARQQSLGIYHQNHTVPLYHLLLPALPRCFFFL